MNALKLADDLNNANGFQYIAQLGLASQAATMLRQQQAEIEALKKQLAFMEGEYPEPTIMAKMMEVDLVRQQQVEIEALKEALEVKVILNEHAQQSMKEVKSLLRKAQEK